MNTRIVEIYNILHSSLLNTDSMRSGQTMQTVNYCIIVVDGIQYSTVFRRNETRFIRLRIRQTHRVAQVGKYMIPLVPLGSFCTA